MESEEKEIDVKDVEITVYSNMDTKFEVRIYHKPTGISVSSGKERGIHRNRMAAMQMLKEEIKNKSLKQ